MGWKFGEGGPTGVMIPTSFSPETFDYVVLCTGKDVCVCVSMA